MGSDPLRLGLGPDNRDHYLGNTLQDTEALDLVLAAAGAAPFVDDSQASDARKMDLHLPETLGNADLALIPEDPARAHRRYLHYVSEMRRLNPDTLHPAPDVADPSTYFRIIDNLFSNLIYIEKLPDTPKLDWNADRYTADYHPNPHEVKLVINLDSDALTAYDNNEDLRYSRNWCRNGVWYLILTGMVVGLSLQIIGLAFTFYLTTMGASASETTNMTTFFNLTQLFFSPLWLWLSEIIGRKPIYIMMAAGYSFINLLFSLTEYIFTDPAKKISYVLGIRAINGIFAIAVPMGFLIASDIASPRSRPIVLMCINIATQAGTAIASIITVTVFTTGRYDTVTNPNAAQDSYTHAGFTSFALSLISVVMTCFMKESAAGVIARKTAKKLGTDVKNIGIKRDPFFKTLREMLGNKQLVLLWFAYVLALICCMLSQQSAGYILTKFYGFPDGQVAKKWNAYQTLSSVLVSCFFVIFLTRKLTQWMGEVRFIVVCSLFSFVPSMMKQVY
ncbi:Major Facilitator Superfamily transporter [Giardia muris]|uniref:Major Facilitator Superfamily transporter n=1 Tax=Giardia muris TaxID=5742 RepID=A0A4Z1T6P6_GIAMU|nr:Major Facilitator Superfamily transporter [Giardia muris]|eukprot:TNJ28807.1 Major Facilitator Superfamily transporter [Giardia muris]